MQNVRGENTSGLFWGLKVLTWFAATAARLKDFKLQPAFDIIDKLITCVFEVLSDLEPEALEYYICPFNPSSDDLASKEEEWPELPESSPPLYKAVYFVSMMLFFMKNEELWEVRTLL